MENVFKIIGIVLVAWIVLSFIGMLVGIVVGLMKVLFWIAIIAGVVYVAGTIAAKGKRKQIGK